MSRPRAFTVRVFTMSRSNWNDSMNRMKCSNPTHGLPVNPSTGL